MTWAPIKLGNGGLVIQFDIALDGTMVGWYGSLGGYVLEPVIKLICGSKY